MSSDRVNAIGKPSLASIGAILLALVFAIAVIACSSAKDDTDADLADDSGGEGEPLASPTATVHVNYGHKGDTLSRATVTKYFAARIIDSKTVDSRRTESVVRFDGGVPIWEFKADHGLLSDISIFSRASKYALKNIDYGKTPAHFEQVIPDEGPPEPLDRGSFYVFEIERQSGSVSYQAVKVLADGSLQAFAAQPRAGTSFVLCCNVQSDFSEPVVLPNQTEAPEQTIEEQPPPP